MNNKLVFFLVVLILLTSSCDSCSCNGKNAFMEIPDGEIVESRNISKYRLRKFRHVTEFYQMMSKQATKICLENNIPPAALLSIAALESGWNRGYVGQISGNILSLGLRKGDSKLPPLNLPRLKKTDEILFDSLEIIKYQQSELKWENRPSSRKKDYRPKPWGGTKYNLAYFKYHPKERGKAFAENINDFVTIFISRDSKIKAYRNTRELMDDLVEKYGKKILLQEKTINEFINGIGGKKNSFNYRKSWPKKVKSIIKNVGLIDLTKDLHNGMIFEESW